MIGTNAEIKRAVVCAGGTGGHLFPAHALASELMRRGYYVHLVSDQRTERFSHNFPCHERHTIEAATPRGRNPFHAAKALYTLLRGYLAAGRLLRDIKPDIVVGFGGYPTVPPLLAAASGNFPTLIHEANAVLGRANRFLSGKVKAIAFGFPFDTDKSLKTFYTGNPVRDDVVAAAGRPYTLSLNDAPFNLVVFGGSQGAQVFSSVVLKAIGLLPEALRRRLRVVQQARADDQAAVKTSYDVMEIQAEVAPFFNNLIEHLAQAHLVISRSGASTTAELAAIGRPAILVPYPHALDHDQAANAQALVDHEGGFVIKQEAFTAEWLSTKLQELMGNGDLLAKIAANAKTQGRCDAAKRLANAADALANREKLTQERIDLVSES